MIPRWNIHVVLKSSANTHVQNCIIHIFFLLQQYSFDVRCSMFLVHVLMTTQPNAAAACGARSNRLHVPSYISLNPPRYSTKHAPTSIKTDD